ncbi:arsenical pump-driving ATPase [Terrabacter sp. Soil810]|uniref:arsenical pump-driving ATPase n=1 Tax=Terrabacter sp. Soil810 TaxID=1736418 RepID=UPI00070B5BF9|nr:arsenical pump-driving ATPase [Terrabacter sp. Soil810]KRF41604.1 arsenical pump-driving ATPase [Terrabacter sp. Soil810]
MPRLPFLDDLPRFLFFTGKGGVGKTSLACATAVRLAGQGKRVLLTSTDPASNVGQVFGVGIGNTITPVPTVPGLDALEIDPQQAVDAYRATIIDPVRDLLPAAEISAMTEQLSGACTTEIASFNEFASLLADESATAAYDHVLFDTAPTGHTVRLLQLPGEWTTYLSDGKGDVSCLGPVAGLDRRRHDYAGALAALTDPTRTRLVLVTRPQRSSLREAARTYEELRELGMTNAHLVVNGVMPSYAVTGAPGDELAHAVRSREEAALDFLPHAVAALPRTTLPLLAVNTVGVPALRALFEPEAPSLPEPAAEIASLPDGFTDLRGLVDGLEADGHGLVMCMGKGGVGKTTVAAAVALELASRGHETLLTTTDPAAHLNETLQAETPHLTVERIDPEQAITEYRARVMAGNGKALDDAGRAVLAEDLKSPCTDEVAVFQQFSHVVFRSRKQFVVLDTAPTGHTLLLLDATGSYHREITRQMSEGAHFVTPLMRLQDPAQTKVVIVSLPETTPVLEAEELQDDLVRAGITPWAWVVNGSLAAAGPSSPFLQARAHAEAEPLTRVTELCQRVAVLPLLASEPVGAAALSELTRPLTEGNLVDAH